jgi:hypothetical protein
VRKTRSCGCVAKCSSASALIAAGKAFPVARKRGIVFSGRTRNSAKRSASVLFFAVRKMPSTSAPAKDADVPRSAAGRGIGATENFNAGAVSGSERRSHGPLMMIPSRPFAKACSCISWRSRSE